MKKNVLIFILVFCLSFTLVACGGQKDTNVNSQQGSQNKSQKGKVQRPINHNEDAPPTEEELKNAKG